MRTWGLRTLGTFYAFSWPFWGLFEDLRTWGSQNIEEPFRNFWWLLVDLLRTLFRKFWGLCEDHLMTFWGTFEDHRILRTLITFWGLWNRLEYLLWTSEDFEGFEDLLRNLRTFCGSVENLRPERTLGNLGAFSWLFEDFVDRFRTSWRPEDLMLAEHWRTFQDLLMTSCGLFEFFLSETFEDFVRTIWWPFEEPLTTTEFWGRW